MGDVVGDAGDVGVDPLEVFLVDLAHALHALVHAFVIAVRAETRTECHNKRSSVRLV